MPIEVFNRFERQTGVQLLEGYGMTEGTAVSSLNPVAGQRKVGSIGLPLPYNELAVGMVEGTTLQRFCETGEIGVLLMRGPNVFPGYMDPSHDASAWVVDAGGKRWFNSGDLARYDEDGYLWLAGRAKDLIIRGGHNIDPQMIEERLCEHPDVVLAAAVGQPDAHAGEVPLAYVVLREGSTATAQALREFAAERIPNARQCRCASRSSRRCRRRRSARSSSHDCVTWPSSESAARCCGRPVSRPRSRFATTSGSAPWPPFVLRMRPLVAAARDALARLPVTFEFE